MKNIINKLTGRADLLERIAVAKTLLEYFERRAAELEAQNDKMKHVLLAWNQVETQLRRDNLALTAKLSIGSKNLQAALVELDELRTYKERQANYKRAYSQRKKHLTNQTENQNPQ